MKIALIELGGSHDECLYTQIKILKSIPKVHVTLIGHKDLETRARYYGELDQKAFFAPQSGFKRWRRLYTIWQYCRRQKFDIIVFNTAQGKAVSRLVRFPFGRIKLMGILHNTRKLKGSFSQRFITKKLQHYFVLSEYLMEHIPPGISASVLYPILFPDYPLEPISKKEDEIWICIPGQLELKRRDYASLLESIEKEGVRSHLKFILLGRSAHAEGDGAFIRKWILDHQMEDHFQIWDDFVPVSTFYNYLKKSDFILPLIHKGTVSEDLYRYQISGAFNLAIGYQKPILTEASISDLLSEYDPISYPKSKMMQTLNELSATSSSPYIDSKWTFEGLKVSYLQALGLV